MSTRVLRKGSDASKEEADLCDSDLLPDLLAEEIGEKDEDIVMDAETFDSSSEEQLSDTIDPLLVEDAAFSTDGNSEEIEKKSKALDDNNERVVEATRKRSTQHISFLSAPISSDEFSRSMRARGSRINSDSVIDRRLTNPIKTTDIASDADGGQGGVHHGFGGGGGDGRSDDEGDDGGDDGGYGWTYIMFGIFLVCSAVAWNLHRKKSSQGPLVV